MFKKILKRINKYNTEIDNINKQLKSGNFKDADKVEKYLLRTSIITI